MSIKLEFDLEKVRKDLGTTSETVLDALERSLEDVADFVTGEAKDRAPVDTGNLTQDVAGGIERENGALFISVYVPANAPSAPYAIATHEEKYRLGINSEAKQAKATVTVGPGYIRRAFTENLTEISDMICERIKK